MSHFALMFADNEDRPYALLVDALATEMAATSGEDVDRVRARIQGVVEEQVTKRDRETRRGLIANAGVGL